jgi:hypothetical protein
MKIKHSETRSEYEEYYNAQLEDLFENDRHFNHKQNYEI